MSILRNILWNFLSFAKLFQIKCPIIFIVKIFFFLWKIKILDQPLKKNWAPFFCCLLLSFLQNSRNLVSILRNFRTKFIHVQRLLLNYKYFRFWDLWTSSRIVFCFVEDKRPYSFFPLFNIWSILDERTKSRQFNA
jgi:hypothetical protein